MLDQNSSSDHQHRILLVIWVVLLFSQVLFLLAVFFSKPEIFNFDVSRSLLGENPIFVVAFALLAIVNFAISLFVRNYSVEQAIAEKQLKYLQTGLIVGCALCEVISILGMILAFAFSYQYFFLWFALGILGIFLHFPRRDTVFAAS